MRQKFLVLHVTDREAPEWDDAIDRPLMDAWLEHRRGPDGWTPNGDRVGDAREARGVAVRDGEFSVTQGPFAEFTEWFMGLEWIEADDLDHAVAMLAKHPTARIGKAVVIPALRDPESEEER